MSALEAIREKIFTTDTFEEIVSRATTEDGVSYVVSLPVEPVDESAGDAGINVQEVGTGDERDIVRKIIETADTGNNVQLIGEPEHTAEILEQIQQVVSANGPQPFDVIRLETRNDDPDPEGNFTVYFDYHPLGDDNNTCPLASVGPDGVSIDSLTSLLEEYAERGRGVLFLAPNAEEMEPESQHGLVTLSMEVREKRIWDLLFYKANFLIPSSEPLKDTAVLFQDITI